MPEYVYTTSCVSSQVELITNMVEQGREITLATMRKHCQGFREWEKEMQLAKEPYVEYFKSKYNGKPCYFMRHSAIEYVWVKDKDE